MLDVIPRLDLRDLQRARTERIHLARAGQAGWEPPDGVQISERQVPMGSRPRVRIFTPTIAPSLPAEPAEPAEPADDSRKDSDRSPRPALVWLHGGGHVMGTVWQDDPRLSRWALDTGAVVVAVDWRWAPEHPYPAALDDTCAALRWCLVGGDDLGIDPTRVVVAGASSGGGLAAGAALRCRDEGDPPLRAQVLIYPMLDDRGETPSARSCTDPRVWNDESNSRAWAAYLKGWSRPVPAYAAPARATDLTGLPPTWLATGALDLFRDEDLEYAARLLAAGVPTEVHVYAGAVHGFDLFAPNAAVSVRFRAELDAAIGATLVGDGGWPSLR